MIFEAHTQSSKYQESISFPCWVILRYADIPHFLSIRVKWETLGFCSGLIVGGGTFLRSFVWTHGLIFPEYIYLALWPSTTLCSTFWRTLAIPSGPSTFHTSTPSQHFPVICDDGHPRGWGVCPVSLGPRFAFPPLAIDVENFSVCE